MRKLFVTDSSILVVWYETMIPVCTARISPKQFLCMTCKGILVNGYFQINHLAPVSFSLWDEQCCLDLSSTVRAVFWYIYIYTYIHIYVYIVSIKPQLKFIFYDGYTMDFSIKFKIIPFFKSNDNKSILNIRIACTRETCVYTHK